MRTKKESVQIPRAGRPALGMTTLVAALVGAALLPLVAVAADPPLAITNARIVTVSGAEIPRGTIVVRDGKIAAVGANVSVPSGARVINASGMTVYPGMIDPYTSLGLVEVPTIAGSVDTSEGGTFNPTADAADSVYAHSELIPIARVVGITTVLTGARGGFIGGQAAAVNLAGWTSQEMLLERGAALFVNLPHWSRVGAQQLGPRPGQTGPPSRQERERAVQPQLTELKNYIARARGYAAMKGAAVKAGQAFVIDREWEAMIPFVNGGRPWIVPADTADQIKDAIAFAKEQKINIVLSGAAEAWKVAKELAEAKVPVLIDSTDMPRSERDPYDVGYANAAALAKAGAKFAFTTGSSSDVRSLPFLAALAVAYGLPAADGVRAITLAPAEILGLADRVGSIDVGKVANLVIAGGDILDVRTLIRQVIIAGKTIEMRSKHSDLYDKFRVR